MIAVSCSYGNDSVALIQWAHDHGADLADEVFVVFIDTGWSSGEWPARVEELELWVAALGFTPVRIDPPIKFEELITSKKGFPNQRYQWCSGILKGLPFLTWIDEIDPGAKAVVMIGKRREESEERADTPEFIESSEYHGGRRVWHPLYLHTESERDALLHHAGVAPLPHRSQECAPCVNANRADFLLLTETEVARVEALEAKVGKTMFRVKRYKSKMYPNGAKGIRQVMQWAHKAPITEDEQQGSSQCSSGYCGY